MKFVVLVVLMSVSIVGCSKNRVGGSAGEGSNPKVTPQTVKELDDELATINELASTYEQSRENYSDYQQSLLFAGRYEFNNLSELKGLKSLLDLLVGNGTSFYNKSKSVYDQFSGTNLNSSQRTALDNAYSKASVAKDYYLEQQTDMPAFTTMSGFNKRVNSIISRAQVLNDLQSELETSREQLADQMQSHMPSRASVKRVIALLDQYIIKAKRIQTDVIELNNETQNMDYVDEDGVLTEASDSVSFHQAAKGVSKLTKGYAGRIATYSNYRAELARAINL
jgi:hypothetical protein